MKINVKVFTISATVLLTIGMALESPANLAEALDSPSLNFTTGGSGNWFRQTKITHDGVDAAQSGVDTNNPAIHDRESWLRTVIGGPGRVGFWWKIATDANRRYWPWGHLTFSAGGQEKSRLVGDADWRYFSFIVPSGEHALEWTLTTWSPFGVVHGWVDQFSFNAFHTNGMSGVVASDFDGDRKTDVSVYAQANGDWYVQGSASRATVTTSFDMEGALAVPADYNGDGETDLALFKPADNLWDVRANNGAQILRRKFGVGVVVPIPGDYDGDGRADLAVYEPNTSTWHIEHSSDGSTNSLAFGWKGVIPVPVDYDGDGKVDIAVYAPKTGTWYIQESGSGEVITKEFGWSEAVPIPADYDGDGKADIAVFHREKADWYILRSSDGITDSFAFGWNGVTPVVADYDGDGVADIAVYSAKNGDWYIEESSTGNLRQEQFGWSKAKPVLLFPLIHEWFKLP